jgi:hypothetical protein
MSFLDGLFDQTVPELPVAVDVVTADRTVEPGFLYRVAGRAAATTVTMASRPPVAGTRFAVKVYTPAPTPPGGTLTVVVPAGQQIEAGDGALGAGVALPDQTLGTYREWICDDAGHWLLVEGGWA